MGGVPVRLKNVADLMCLSELAGSPWVHKVRAKSTLGEFRRQTEMTDMRGMKSVATGLVLTIGAASFVGTADAKDHKRIWKRHGQVERHYDRGDRGDYDRGDRHDYDDDDDDDRDGDRAAAAIIGFGVGAILGGALSSPHYYAPSYYYQPAPPV